MNIPYDYYKNKKLIYFGFPSYSSISKKLNGRCNKMSSIRESAKAYESPATKNITDLKEVSTEMDITEKEFTDKDGKPFKVNLVSINDEEYRIPNSVLRDLKTIISDRPEITKFKVAKTGSGMQTSYTVIPLD